MQLGLGKGNDDNNYLKPAPYNLQQIIYMTTIQELKGIILC